MSWVVAHFERCSKRRIVMFEIPSTGKSASRADSQTHRMRHSGSTLRVQYQKYLRCPFGTFALMLTFISFHFEVATICASFTFALKVHVRRNFGLNSASNFFAHVACGRAQAGGTMLDRALPGSRRHMHLLVAIAGVCS